MSRSSYPGGPLRNIHRFDTIPAMLDASAEKWGDAVFMREPSSDGGTAEVSFRRIHEMSEAFARGLLQLGEKPVVAVSGRNGISWAVTFLGTMKAGGVVVPIDKELSTADISAIIHYSGAGTFVFDGAFQEAVQTLVGTGKAHCSSHFVMNCSEKPLFTTIERLMEKGAGSTRVLPTDTDSNDVAVISYTSGTMGAAKGVVLSHGNILSDLQMMLSSAYIENDEVFLSVLPFHHMYECVCGFLCPLQHGCTVVISRGLRYILDDLSEHGITLMLGVPLLWEGMYRRIIGQIRSMKGGALKFAFGKMVCSAGEFFGNRGIRKKVFARVHERFGGKLRTLVSGGAALDAQVMSGFADLGIRMLQGYGLTECSPIVAVCRYDVLEPGTVGPPLPDVEVRIDDPDPEGAGEILVRGPNVMIGYHNDPAATSRVLSPDGWFRTGDFGVFRNGVLRVTGRKKNVIVAKNGKNVYPEELEHVLNRCGYISESLVFGRESETKGEEIWTIVLPDYEALINLAESRGAKLTEEFGLGVIRGEIVRVNSQNPSYKRISHFILREGEFPKTTTKKIKRQQVLREAGLSKERVFAVSGGE
jgi:long-chain acyl-CoA synthetase